MNKQDSNWSNITNNFGLLSDCKDYKKEELVFGISIYFNLHAAEKNKTNPF